MDRNELIQGLANEIGLEGKQKGVDSRYDPNTGTLYVGSKVYHNADLERARRFFEKSKKKSRSLNDASSDLYEIAEIAIKHFQRQCDEIGGRVIVDGTGAIK